MNLSSPADHEAAGPVVATVDPVAAVLPAPAAESVAGIEAATDPAELAHAVAFSHASGIGPRRLGLLATRFGSLCAAWEAPPAQLATVLDARCTEALLALRRRLDPGAALAAVAAAGAVALPPEDGRYPPLLRQTDRAPRLLYLRGDPGHLVARSLAVVGTRQVSAYGQRATAHLVDQLAAAGLGIVSGAALGVDALAHRRALEAGAPTVAVLGSGIDQAYPRGNRRLIEQIAAEGAVVSELPPGARPLRGHFPARNRIISGLALATLVIEAGERSGALITADFALAQGRDVFAVPGDIFREQSLGCNRLIAAGAGPALDAADILTALSLEGVALQNQFRRQAPLDPEEAAILEALRDQPLDTDALARTLRAPVAAVARRLTLLELRGMVQAGAGLRWVALG